MAYDGGIYPLGKEEADLVDNENYYWSHGDRSDNAPQR